MSESAHEFWTTQDSYHDLAKEYENNIERTHPDIVTSRRLCSCLDYVAWCGCAITSVSYYEYRGERV